MPNSQAQKAIGIFDSGIGGLTVLREVRRLLPHENLIYLGDTARVPYGTKSPETVLRYTVRNLLFLLEQGVKAVVVACNTASAYGLETLKDHFKVPLLGVIEPGARKAEGVSQSHVIGVMGTEGTIRSDAYPQALKKINSQVATLSQACPLLVSLVEEGWTEGEVVDLVLKKYLHTFLEEKKLDTIILGCTHYPLLKSSIQKIVGEKITLVDSAIETAHSLQEVLRTMDQLSPITQEGSLRFFSTDAPERMQRLGQHFLGMPIPHVERVDIL